MSTTDFRAILHKYANEDVSLGTWFIGLEVEHINEHSMCCGTPPGMTIFQVYFLFFNIILKEKFTNLVAYFPECEWKAQAGSVCVASFDWSCSGICKSVDRIKEVHAKCSEDASAIWGVSL